MQNRVIYQLFGIDVSRWQGDFDFARAIMEHKIEFAIIKAGGSDKGIYTDRQFENNYLKAKAAGIHIGAYWYSKALSVQDAIRDAAFFHNLLNGKQFDLPIYIDVEEKQMFALGASKLADVVVAFCDYLEKCGYYVGIYSSSSYFSSYLNDPRLQKYAKWVAAWGTKKPADCGVWQFGGETNKIRSNKINGVTVDQNYLYVDYPSAIHRLGLNGYTAIEEHPGDTYPRDVMVALNAKGYSYKYLYKILQELMGGES